MMSNNRTTLALCPFCGGEAAMKHVTQLWEPRESYWAACQNCHMSGKHYHTEAEAIAAWNTRATHGTLTAEQVRTAIFNGSSYASYDGAKYYADGISMQAIADELNARAERTCEPTEEWCCDHCGADLIECNVGVAAGGGAYELDPPILVNYCPNCGCKVVKR